MACWSCDIAQAKLLLDFGADVHASTGPPELVPVETMATWYVDEQLAMINRILDLESHWSSCLRSGLKPLHVACYQCN